MSKFNHYAEYHDALFDIKTRKKIVFHSIKLIKQIQLSHSVYALAGTGVSGILGALVAEKCGLEFVYVRRPEEHPLDSRRVCGVLKDDGCLFFDDLVHSGKTLQRVVLALDSLMNGIDSNGNFKNTLPRPNVIGVVAYSQNLSHMNNVTDLYSFEHRNMRPVKFWSVQHFIRNGMAMP